MEQTGCGVGGQRRRAHEFPDREPRLLFGGRGWHEPHVRHHGAGRWQGSAAADDRGILPRAFKDLLPSDATFRLARLATIQAAQDLDPSGGLVSSVTQAWTAVGVN